MVIRSVAIPTDANWDVSNALHTWLADLQEFGQQRDTAQAEGHCLPLGSA